MQTTNVDMIDKFRKVYADAVIPHDLPDKERNKAYSKANTVRELQWKGERIPLAEAVELYALLYGYNEFESDMLERLQTEFPDSGIEVTPARESSVAVYLHVPDDFQDRVEQFAVDNFQAEEIDWVGDTLRIFWD